MRQAVRERVTGARAGTEGPRAEQYLSERRPARAKAHYRRRAVDRKVDGWGDKSSSSIRKCRRGCAPPLRASSQIPVAPIEARVSRQIELTSGCSSGAAHWSSRWDGQRSERLS